MMPKIYIEAEIFSSAKFERGWAVKNGSISFSELVTHFLLNRLLKDRGKCVCDRHNKIEIIN